MRQTHGRVCAALAVAAIAGVVIATEARSDAPGSAVDAANQAVNEVPFDHTIHAGQYRIPCLDCHVYADRSPVAGLPSGRKCMGCHKFVASDKPAIQKLRERVAAGQPLAWLRAFAVPDFIYFSHRMHVRAKVSCTECHGDMAAQRTVTQDRPFTMGRCLACHEDRHASRDCLSCHK
jgi:hypothetical protein